jgi:hypothetical protein
LAALLLWGVRRRRAEDRTALLQQGESQTNATAATEDLDAALADRLLSMPDEAPAPKTTPIADNKR